MLRLALPKGSLEKPTLQLFEDADLHVRRSSDVEYKATIDDPRVDEVAVLRPQEIPDYVADGLFDVGIAGRDSINECGRDVVSLGVLRYSRATDRPFNIVLAVAQDAPYQRVEDLPETGLPVVRRLTGGGAIRHENELTYSIAAPVGFFGERLKESYCRVVEAIREALGKVGARCERAAPGDDDSAFLCYERRSGFDLVAGARKIVGSAQRRDGRRVLQHGSIPLAAVAEAETPKAREQLFDATPVREIMTARAQVVTPGTDVAEAARTMLYLEVHRLFVVDGSELVGVISQSDISGAVATAKL